MTNLTEIQVEITHVRLPVITKNDYIDTGKNIDSISIFLT